MTEKEAKALTLKVWRYLAKHPEKGKKDTPQWLKIVRLRNACPLCEIFRSWGCVATGCPLDTANNNCYDSWSVFYSWCNSPIGSLERAKAAADLVAIVKGWKV